VNSFRKLGSIGLVRVRPDEIPRYKPAFRGLLAGMDGSIWVDVYEESRRISGPVFASPVERQSGWSSPIVFDVFERNGTYIGRVRFPDNA
jgi:hypothetical protein